MTGWENLENCIDYIFPVQIIIFNFIIRSPLFKNIFGFNFYQLLSLNIHT